MEAEPVEAEPVEPGPTEEKWDVVVVGSGPGGLTTAACLSAVGHRVLVLERHDVAGGNTQVFRRHHGDDWFEFDVGVHYVGEFGHGQLLHNIFASLGMADRMTFRPLDPDGFDTLRFPDFEFRVPASWEDYQARLIEQFPNDRAGIERAITVLHSVATESRMIFGGDRPTFDEWAFRPLSQLFDEAELSQQCQAVLDHWSMLYAGAPQETAIFMHARLIDHYMGGAFYPEGGGQMMAARLIQVIEACGGEVRTLSAVQRILIEKGTARGVELDTGESIDAPIVVANADYRRLMTRLIDAHHLAPGTRDWAQNAEMTLGLICAYVVVSKPLPGPNCNYFLLPDYRTDELHHELEAGALPDGVLPTYVAMTSRKDPDNPDLCPPGHTNFQIMSFAPRGHDFWGVETGPADGGHYRRNDRYRQRKEEITDRLIDAAEELLGPFRDDIVHLELASPLTHERYTHSSGGTSYGYKHSPEQSGNHRPQLRTEIDGLWVVGANTATGHGIGGAMIGGVMCAGEIVDRPLIAEVALGQSILDPGTIPPDPEPFDALEFSRGARLREKRANTTASRRARGTR